jgi:hypothetical protein
VVASPAARPEEWREFGSIRFSAAAKLSEKACTSAFSVLARIVRERMLRAGVGAGVAGRPVLCEVPPGVIAPQAEREASSSVA